MQNENENKLYNVFKQILLQNREVSIRRDTDRDLIIVSVAGFNKLQNLKLMHSYTIENGKIPDDGELAYIFNLLNQKITY